MPRRRALATPAPLRASQASCPFRPAESPAPGRSAAAPAPPARRPSGPTRGRHAASDPILLGAAVSLKVTGSRLQILDVAGAEKRPLAGDAASPPRWREVIAARLRRQAPLPAPGVGRTF